MAEDVEQELSVASAASCSSSGFIAFPNYGKRAVVNRRKQRKRGKTGPPRNDVLLSLLSLLPPVQIRPAPCSCPIFLPQSASVPPLKTQVLRRMGRPAKRTSRQCKGAPRIGQAKRLLAPALGVRWCGFESPFKAQVPAALSCQFEPSDLVSRIPRERHMEREPHSANKLVTNRSLH
jgi:hypothetical protein